MNNDQARNRNSWNKIYQNEYHDDYVPEGYAPPQGYTSVGGQNGYSDYQNSTINPYGAHQTQQVSEYSDSEASATNSYGTHQTASTVNDDEIPKEEIREFVSSRKSRAKAKEAEPKNKQPKTARGQRREKVANENNGEVSATDAPKGRVEWREGVFYWYDPVDEEFKKAAFHDQYRSQFIMEDRAEGSYVVAPTSGKGADDITSACSAFNQLEVSSLFLSVIPDSTILWGWRISTPLIYVLELSIREEMLTPNSGESQIEKPGETSWIVTTIRSYI